MTKLLVFVSTVKEILRVINVIDVSQVTMVIQPIVLIVFHASAHFLRAALVPLVSSMRMMVYPPVITVLKGTQAETVNCVWMATMEIHW